MGEHVDERTFSIVFHDDSIAMNDVIQTIAKSLRQEFSVEFVRDRLPDGSATMSFGCHLEPAMRADSAAATSAHRISAGLRRHHAIRVNASGCSVQEGYDRAIADIDIVNSGAHDIYGKPATPIPYFTYETFVRDCRHLRTKRRNRKLGERAKSPRFDLIATMPSVRDGQP
ncbi:hypothetical protein [Sphingobium yanoikuyae]|uniref:hypothetical protein n=1 Tax=Sphingobium yanoikuyae TaxID=13690 RepID=UPI000262C0BA|nr:hypothetical protein [Sphingobium yanoikuyae]